MYPFGVFHTSSKSTYHQKMKPKLLEHLRTFPRKLNSKTHEFDNQSNTRTIISTLYFHYTIYTKHIQPMARILHHKYHIQKIIHYSLICWIQNNSDTNIQHKTDLSGQYYERNLACKTLNIVNPLHYRFVQNHKSLTHLFYMKIIKFNFLIEFNIHYFYQQWNIQTHIKI
jgi:hypothetical protein